MTAADAGQHCPTVAAVKAVPVGNQGFRQDSSAPATCSPRLLVLYLDARNNPLQ